MPFPFLDLPPELRNMVYASVYWQIHDLWVKQYRKTLTVAKRSFLCREIPPQLRDGISLSRTCRTVRHETQVHCSSAIRSTDHELRLCEESDKAVFLHLRRTRGLSLVRLRILPFPTRSLRLRFDFDGKYWKALSGLRHNFPALESLELDIKSAVERGHPDRARALGRFMDSLHLITGRIRFVDFSRWIVHDLELIIARRVRPGHCELWTLIFEKPVAETQGRLDLWHEDHVHSSRGHESRWMWE